MLTALVLLGVVVLLIAANALFVFAEFAFVTVDRAQVEQAAEQGDGRSKGLLGALRSLSTQLSGAQLGITVSSLAVGYIAEPAVAGLLRGPVGLTGLGAGATTAVTVALAFTLATITQMVFGELVPKNWAIAEPMRIGRAVAGPHRAFTMATRPVIVVFNGAANAVVRAFGIEPAEELASARTPAELASLAAHSASEGTLERETAELLTRSIEFGDRMAADVMTSRPRVRFVRSDDVVAEVLALSARTGHARFPVTGAGRDDVIGVVHFKHALAVPEERRATTAVREITRDIPAVPETIELDPLLIQLRAAGTQMALVVDEYGGTAGIVTLEDLVEEIVGEIEDEQDVPLGRVRRNADGTWSLSGLLRPDEIEDITGLRLPEGEETETLGGLLIERLGRLPDSGDVVQFGVSDERDPDDDGVPRPCGVRLRVTRMDGRRVDRVTLQRLSVEWGVDEDGKPVEEAAR